MKIAVLLLAISTISNTFGQMRLDGAYIGNNLYVINPMKDEEPGYCTDSVYVNGKRYDGNLNAGAYEIALDSLGLKFYDSVSIIIYHHPDCRPKVLNPTGSHSPTFSVRKLNLTETGLLTWQYTGLRKQLFTIETYRWNRWLEVGELIGNENDSLENYAFQCELHSGKNTYRIVYVDSVALAKITNRDDLPKLESRSRSEFPRTSNTVHIESGVAEVKLNYNRKTKRIEFSAPTAYQIYNAQGVLIQESLKKIPDLHLETLEKGIYYLNYDKRTKKISVRN